jgi:hypothetical protein
MKILMSALACRPGNGFGTPWGSEPPWPQRLQEGSVLTNSATIPVVLRGFGRCSCPDGVYTNVDRRDIDPVGH